MMSDEDNQKYHTERKYRAVINLLESLKGKIGKDEWMEINSIVKEGIREAKQKESERMTEMYRKLFDRLDHKIKEGRHNGNNR